MNINNIKEKFKQQYPNVAVGVGPGPSLQVRVKNKDQKNKIPTTFMSVPVVILVVGEIRAN